VRDGEHRERGVSLGRITMIPVRLTDCDITVIVDWDVRWERESADATMRRRVGVLSGIDGVLHYCATSGVGALSIQGCLVFIRPQSTNRGGHDAPNWEAGRYANRYEQSVDSKSKQ
jgi:hypothetical protein